MGGRQDSASLTDTGDKLDKDGIDMERSKTKKIVLLAALLLIAAILAGCTATPDNTGNNQGGTGNQDIVPFPVRSPSLTGALLPTPTIGAIINLPGSTTGIIQPTSNIWGNIITSQQPFLSPTPTVWGGIVVMTSTPGLISPTPASNVLKLGAEGPAVRSLQQRLRDLGYNIGSVDGDFGQTTENAVKAFQSRNGLTVDGIAGTATLNRLNSSSALPPRPTPSPTPRPTATPRISQNVFLQNGSSGSDVRSMQKRLIDLGYMLGTPTGRFDAATEAAVVAFQNRNMSYSDGIAGPQTLEKLYSSSARGTSTPQGVVGTSLQRGMTDSAAVRLVQSRLRDLRYYSGGIDGDFGASTEAAVKAFQSANNLTPDGRVGAGTYSKLFGTDAGTNNPTARPGTTAEPTRIPVYINVTPHPQGSYVTLREGNSGTLVRALQDALRKQGFFELTVDGLYGFGTSDAVRNFQRAKGLSQDGIAGPATQRILYEGDFPAGS